MINQRVNFNGNQPLTNNPALKPVRFGKLPMTYGRPQATDTIKHADGFETNVTSLIDGGQIFGTIDDVLTKAKKSVYVNMYGFQNSTTAPERTAPEGTPGADKQQAITGHLIKLAKDGVRVKVVLDNSFDREKGINKNQTMIEYLRENGVEVVTYPEDAAHINHVKLLIVDGKKAVIGGMNWGNHSPANRDACVFLEGDDVANLVDQIFRVDYKFAGGDLRTVPNTGETFDNPDLKVLTTSPVESPDGGHNEIYEEILQQIDSAKESIVAQLFVLTDKAITEKLIDAHKRITKSGGEGVRILVDPGLYLKFKNCRPAITKLFNAGVPIKFLDVDWAAEEKLHSKLAVFDNEKTLIGSANWSKAGLYSNVPEDDDEDQKYPQDGLNRGNHEASLLITSKKLASAFMENFNTLWDDNSMNMMGVGKLYRMKMSALEAAGIIEAPKFSGNSSVKHSDKLNTVA